MIQRELLKSLREWSNRDGRKPLVLRGARQVGKTTLVKQFGKEFDYFIHLNLEKSEDVNPFTLTDNVKEIFQFVCLKKKLKIEKGKRTLLFIDEIQNEPKAVALLRYFYEDMPEIYVIAAGSRLQTLIKQRLSFPVGRVEYLSLRPCSFLEYLNACENYDLAEMIKIHSVSSIFHEEIMKQFNRYALIGGMPEIVAKYAKNNDITELSPVYMSLLDGYDEDVEKYSKNEKQSKVIRHILGKGWNMAGQSIKFEGFGESTYTSREVHEAFDVMQKAFLLNLDYPVTSVKVPEIPTITRSPKLIWLDIGIVNFSADVQTQYLENKDLLDTFRGQAAEQIVAQELRIVLDKKYKKEQNYWVRAKKGSNAEVDFVWKFDNKLIPIEVKAGTNSHLRSLQSFMMQEGSGDVAIRVWSGEYSTDEINTATGKTFKLINLPFYYLGIIDEILKENIG
ncbi:MAG: AAA family ATPase [Muribaculaceae bacterium]|jgi:uncharacterized protein|nr:AAA family ATPase [Muribaculaceae bacterium]